MAIPVKTVATNRAATAKDWISRPFMSYNLKGHTYDPVFPQDRQDICVVLKELRLDDGGGSHEMLYLVWWDKSEHMRCHDLGLGLLGNPLKLRVIKTGDEIRIELEGPSGYKSQSFSKKEIDLKD